MARTPPMSRSIPRTGAVEVIDYVAVEDVGRIVNPLTLHGQAVGAIVQGLGGALLEHLVYDEEGQLLTASLADYLHADRRRFPAHSRAIALEEQPSPNNPLGAKGAGEGGVVPVGGVIANAVASALAALRGRAARAAAVAAARVAAHPAACRREARMNILLTPARIGAVEIKNRIVMPPMTTRTADAEGFVTDDTINYYMARVQGGVGLITARDGGARALRPPSPPRARHL